MKRTIVVALLTGSLLICATACGTNTSETTAPETTTEVTTEATTESTTTTTTESTSAEPLPSFSPEEYSGVLADKVNSFDWKDAALGVVNYDGVDYPATPVYAPGKDISFSFKSSEEFTLFSAVKVTEATLTEYGANVVSNLPRLDGISDASGSLTIDKADNAYSFTLKGDVVEAGYYYLITLNDASGEYYYLSVRAL